MRLHVVLYAFSYQLLSNVTVFAKYTEGLATHKFLPIIERFKRVAHYGTLATYIRSYRRVHFHSEDWSLFPLSPFGRSTK